MFGDRPAANFQTAAGTNVYVHVNPDEADHMLVDPAYKLEKLEEAYEKLEALFMAYKRVEDESQTAIEVPSFTSMTLYDNWFEIEKSIRKLDRMFLKVEKFHARQFIDAENHERREQRMLTRKRDRWTDNYTYFFGGLTEEEQMYRDYFQTDIENDPEDDKADAIKDEIDIASQGEFKFSNYDFIETAMEVDAHESLMDIIDRKIFKFKYRMNNDDLNTYLRRMDRVIKRQLERAKRRDPMIDVNLNELLEEGERENALGTTIYKLAQGDIIHDKVSETLSPIKQYMLDESLIQYQDYFESDEEEAEFFEYMKELPGRDRIKFTEIFEDYTIPKRDGKGYVKIPKREYNPELSFFSNAALDLIDFKDRVLPLANDAARLDGTFEYQRMSVNETYDMIKERRSGINKFLEGQGRPAIAFDNQELLSSEELLSSDEFTQEDHVEKKKSKKDVKDDLKTSSSDE